MRRPGIKNHVLDGLPASSLAELYAAESRRVEQEFEIAGDGRSAMLARSDLVDRIVVRLYREFVSADRDGPENFCVVAVGGYGREELFPHSDVDLLFLFGEDHDRRLFHEAVAAIARSLWDLRMRVGHSAHTLAECGELHRDNLEFNVSLLDARFLAGDPQLFARLYHRVIPRLVARERRDLVLDLLEMTRQRHRKHEDTIFHLEPNIKEVPGGLRDYHVARWLALINELERENRWAMPPESTWPPSRREAANRAFEFLAATRAFIHYQRRRDDNLLTYELQDVAAARGLGGRSGASAAANSTTVSHGVSPEEWMRTYFRHARSIQRLTRQLMDEVPPTRSALYGLFQDWRSRLSNADFTVLKGQIFPRHAASTVDDVDSLLSLFEMVARHGLDLSREAERWVEEVLSRTVPEDTPITPPCLWSRFRTLLLLPHAAHALRSMHELGLLGALFPEFGAIDALVTRDFYHRYTVDEHSFMALQHLHELGALSRSAAVARKRQMATDLSPLNTQWKQKFAEIFVEVERPELLFFALLFHDVGKGMNVPHHTQGSLETVAAIAARLNLPAADHEVIHFLIARHLEMSATLLRRDIFDPETVRAFSKVVGTPERLKMLCLLTYADVSAVNPEALTPWKAEMLWRLYAATCNDLARNVDDERVRTAEADTAKMRIALDLIRPSTARELNQFLEGFPTRYLQTRSAEEVAAHFIHSRRLQDHPVQMIFASREHFHELTIITHDRPFLFASLTGALAAWGMNILKAEAFSNSAGIVLDMFRFTDLHQTLVLNPSEVARFERSILGVLTGEVNVQDLMDGQVNRHRVQPPKLDIPTHIRFDDQCSSHSTLLELITADRPGLLYDISRTLAELGFNISVALIDTEGRKAIDVFYLTSEGTKLLAREQERARRELLRALQAAG